MTSRLMTRAEAAELCRLTPAGFSQWVRAGRLPGPIAGTRRWDRVCLNAALDNLSGLMPIKSDQSGETALDRWKRKRDARKANKGGQ